MLFYSCQQHRFTHATGCPRQAAVDVLGYLPGPALPANAGACDLLAGEVFAYAVGAGVGVVDVRPGPLWSPAVAVCVCAECARLLLVCHVLHHTCATSLCMLRTLPCARPSAGGGGSVWGDVPQHWVAMALLSHHCGCRRQAATCRPRRLNECLICSWHRWH